MLVYSSENVHPFAEEAEALFLAHYDEIADHKLELNYSVAHYEQMASAKCLIIHAAREEGTEELVGYHIFKVYRHPRYQATIVAQSDIFFLRPDKRQGLAGYKFLKHSIEVLRRAGVNRVMLHTKPHLDFGKLIERLGGKMFETTYAIDLE